jgi:hypothetical protein
MAAFPELLRAGFEAGATNFDTAITDVSAKSTYPHYTDLIGKYNIVPWRGAYVWLIDQSIGTTAHANYQTQAAFNVAASNYWSVGFAFYAKSTVMANGNRTSLVWANAVKEFCLQLYYTTAAGLQLLLTETESTAVGTNPVVSLTENAWHWIELHGVVDSGAGNDGSVSVVLDGNTVGTVSSLDQAAFTDLYIGLEDIDAGHTAGVYAFDDILVSGIDTSAVRIGYRSQYPWNPHVSAPASTSYGEHLFVGPGTIDSAALLTANAGDTMRLYDTDTAYTAGSYGAVGEANFSSGMPVIEGPLKFERGCYCVITAAGANGARGIVNISQSPVSGYPIASCYQNKANLKSYAQQRVRLSGNR